MYSFPVVCSEEFALRLRSCALYTEISNLILPNQIRVFDIVEQLAAKAESLSWLDVLNLLPCKYGQMTSPFGLAVSPSVVLRCKADADVKDQNHLKLCAYEITSDLCANKIYLYYLSGLLRVWDMSIGKFCNEEYVHGGYQDDDELITSSALTSDCSLFEDDTVNYLLHFQNLTCSIQPCIRVIKHYEQLGMLVANASHYDKTIRFFSSISLLMIQKVSLNCKLAETEKNMTDDAVSSSNIVEDFEYIHHKRLLLISFTARNDVYIVSSVSGVVLLKLAGHAQGVCPKLLYIPSIDTVITADPCRRKPLLHVWLLQSPHLQQLLRPKIECDESVDFTLGKLLDKITLNIQLLDPQEMNTPSGDWVIAHIAALSHSEKYVTVICNTENRSSTVHPLRIRQLKEVRNRPLGPPDWTDIPALPAVGSKVAVWRIPDHNIFSSCCSATNSKGRQYSNVEKFCVALQDLNNRLAVLTHYDSAVLDIDVIRDQAQAISISVTPNSNDDEHQAVFLDDVLFAVNRFRQFQQAPTHHKISSISSSRKLCGHSCSITTLSYLNTSKLLATSSADGLVRFWDPTLGKHMLTVSPPRPCVRTWPGTFQGITPQLTTVDQEYDEVFALSIKEELLRLKLRPLVENSDATITCKRMMATCIEPLTSGSNLQLDSKSVLEAIHLDCKASNCNERGFIYVLRNKSVHSIVTPGFDAHFIRLSDPKIVTSSFCSDEKELLILFARRKYIEKAYYVHSNDVKIKSVHQSFENALSNGAELPSTLVDNANIVKFSSTNNMLQNHGDDPKNSSVDSLFLSINIKIKQKVDVQYMLTVAVGRGTIGLPAKQYDNRQELTVVQGIRDLVMQNWDFCWSKVRFSISGTYLK